jgi:hypothetical protein
MKHKTLYKNLQTILNHNVESGELSHTSLSKHWNFQNEIGDKLQEQMKYLGNLPTLNEAVDKRLETLIPKYSHVLDSTNPDSVQSLMSRYLPKEEGSMKNIQINNLRAYLIKYDIQGEYLNLKKFRESILSVKLDEQEDEILVNTYTHINIIQFVKILYDNTFLYSSPYNYYERFVKLFNNVVGDESITKGRGFCKKLRPADLEKLIQILIYSNKFLKVEEVIKLKLYDVNKTLINDLKISGLKLSNKELFSLLQLTFQNNENPSSQISENIEVLYDNFMSSKTFEKNDDFFKKFLQYNFTLSYDDTNLMNEPLTKRVINDILDYNITPDRYLLKLLLKYSWTVGNVKMIELIVQFLLQNYAMDKETLQMIQSSLDQQNLIPVIQGLSQVKDTLELRLYDHIDDIERVDDYRGIVFQ